jgi:hypothetical protein
VGVVAGAADHSHSHSSDHAGYHRPSSSPVALASFRPQPPLAHRGKAAANECRMSVVKYRVGSKADAFVAQHPVPLRPDKPHLQLDPWAAMAHLPSPMAQPVA